MLKSILFAFFVLGNAVLSQEEEEDGSVVTLTQDNFDKVIGSADISLVKFYAPWCGHCQQLAPQYKAAANELKHKVLFGEVDCTVETDLAEKYGITGYPTLKIFRKDVDAPSDYNGPRDASGIIRYMKKQSEPIVQPIDSELMYRAVTVNSDISVLMYVSDLTSEAYKTFENVAKKHFELISFGVVSDPALMATFGHADGEIVAYRNFEGINDKDSRSVVYDSVNYPDLDKWVLIMSIPSAALLTRENYASYQKVDLPRLVVFGKNLREDSNPAGVRYVVNRLRKAAAPYIGRIVFVAMDTTNNDFAECNFDQKSDAKYFMGIYDSASKYCFNDEAKPLKGLKVADIDAFAKDYLDGKLVPYLKSQPVPEIPEENSVKIVVGSNFKEEVVDSDKDVFLAVYAPWCGHCKHLLPVWEELAEKNKENRNRLTIAKIDGTENDLPRGFDFTGFPTIFWVEAGKGAKPITYEGARTIEAFEKYIEVHRTVGRDAEEAPKDEL